MALGANAPFLNGNQAYLGVECSDMGDPASGNITFMYRSTGGAAPVPQAYPGGDLFTLDGNRIWALGKDIFRSDTAGNSWTKLAMVTWDGQFDFVSAQQGWAVGHDGVVLAYRAGGGIEGS